jgi:sugar/nucleoside kinase (ribokinase family)
MTNFAIPGVSFSREPLAVVGNLNLDIKTAAIEGDARLFSDGETSVECIYECIGGGAANAAAAAAGLGGRPHLFSCVGNDDLGNRLEDALRNHGVTPHLVRKPVATGRSINLNWTGDQRHFVSSLPNCRLMTVEDVIGAVHAATDCRQLLRADVWFSEPMLAGGNRVLLEGARKHGIETYLDINWDPEWGTGDLGRIAERKERLRAVLPWVSCVQGNIRELTRFTGTENIAAACDALLRDGCSEVVVHRGADGAMSVARDRAIVEVPAIAVPKIACSTGPGDVFNAAYMLLRSLSVRERLQQSCVAAAAHLSGAETLLPRLD